MDFFTGKTKLYANVIFKLAQNSISSTDKKEEEELAKILGNVIFDRDGPRALVNVKFNREDKLIVKLFRPFSEIDSSYESIQHISIYVGVFPFQKKGISRYSYLRYNIENYLNELYILEQRLLAYLKIIERIYKKSKIKSQVNSTTKQLRIIVTKSFDGYVRARGSHIHCNRYSDKDIDRLSMFDTLSKSQDKQFVRNLELLHKIAYKDIRKKWKKRILDDIKSIHKLNEMYFGSIHKIIVKNGVLINPWEN